MSALFVGIDPGMTGAVSVLDAAGSVVGFWDAPTVEVVKQGKKGPSKRHEPDVAAMADIMRKVASLGDVRLVCLEKVQPMPGKRRRGAGPAVDAAGMEGAWGALPNFSLGEGYGLWRMAVVFAGLPLERVAPATWRSLLLRGLPAGKESGRLRAIELFPAHAANLKRVKDHGRADSLLLAEFARRTAR